MSSEVINGVTWNINSNGTITSASDYGSNVIVPDTVVGITVVGFSDEIFKNQTTIQTISIPDSVTSLPTRFFGTSDNNTLTSVTFTENSQLTTIGQSAFHKCFALSDFKIPSTVTTFSGTHQFELTAMSSVTIPAGLTKLDQGAFYSMPNLTELIFAPNSNLDEFAQGYAFTSSSNLKVIINFPAQNFPNNSKFSSNTFHSIASNPIVIFSEETSATQGNTFINDSNLTNRWNTTPSFYVRPLTNSNISTLLAANVTFAQLYTAGSTITQLQTADASVAELYAAGASVAELYAAGIPVAELYAAGIPVAKLYAAGITVVELYTVGVSVAELVAINITKQALLAANVPEIDIDIAQMNIKIHSDFTISDGTNSSAFVKGEVYTTTSFTSKLTTNLNNTVTVGGEYTTTDGTNYYRIYLEFANAVTLTGMPKYIFNVLDNKVYVEAGGQVNFRNVNLDANMTFNITKDAVSHAQTGEDILGLESGEKSSRYNIRMNNDDTIFFTSSQLYNSSLGRVTSYKYKIPTSTEWDAANIVMKGTEDTTQVTDKLYWTQRGAHLTGKSTGTTWGEVFDIDETGNFVVIAGRTENINGISNVGTLRAYEYKIPTSTEWNNADIYKDSDANQESGKFYWTQVGDTIEGTVTANAQWGMGVSISGDGSRISWSTRQVLTTTPQVVPELRVYQYNGTTWDQLGYGIISDDTTNSGGHGKQQKLNDTGDIVVISDQFWRIPGELMVGKAYVYKYKIPTSTEWSTNNFVAKGTETTKDPDKLYWTRIGEFTGSQTGSSLYSKAMDINKTGSRVVFGSSKSLTGSSIGLVEVFEYSGSGTTWTKIGSITGDGVGITGGSGLLNNRIGQSVAMNTTGNIIAFSQTEGTINSISKPGIIGVAEYKNGNWEYIGNDIIGLNADDKLGFSTAMGSNMVAVGGPHFNSDTGMAQVYQIEESAISHTSTISAGNHFINNFVSKLDTDISSYSLSYDEPNNSIVVGDIVRDISFSITSNDTTIFDTSITEMTSSTNTLPFITYGQPEPNYNKEGVEFIDTIQIKIPTAFTISDGTNSSVFEPEIISPDNPLNTPNVFASTDAKTTTPEKWQDIQISRTGQYMVAVVGGNTFDINIATGNVWVSTDFGENWTEVTVGGDAQQWISAMVSGDGSVMMVKARGNILYKSTDHGVYWTQVTITIPDKVYADNNNYGTSAAGISSIWMKMANDGLNLYTLYCNNPTAGGQHANVSYYTFIRSTDGGDNWSETTSTYGKISTFNTSRNGQYIVLIYYDNSTKPKYSDDYGETFIELTNGPIGSAGASDYQNAVCISNTGKICLELWAQTCIFHNFDVTTGTVSNGTNDAPDTTVTMPEDYTGGRRFTLNNSNDGKYIFYYGYMQWGSGNTVGYYSNDYGATFSSHTSDSPFYQTHTYGQPIDRIWGAVFSDDNKYIAVVQENNFIYVRKNTFIQNIYTLQTFADKLSTDLNNTVTFGVDYSITDSTPYYRIYLQFANAVTLTGMPKYIFNIPFSDFSVKAGGQVNLRHVNLDADMTITTSYDTTSNTSTIPAGNHYINQFVSTIETDLVNFPLSYDASINAITFDGLAQDISMNITSNDTTIFDTSITEITTTDKTLPFITYGQPDPRLKDYSDNGITTNEFVSNGYTILQLLAGSAIPDWNFVTDANHFDQSYLKGFTDVSGSVVIRNDSRLITNGDLSLGGNLTGTTSLLNDDMTLKSRLFMGEDISANGKVYVGGDLSVNGQFSGDFANGIIPPSAISSGGGGIDIAGHVYFAEDVSFNGPTVDVSNTLPVNQIEFYDGTTMTTHDDNILSGSFADSNPDVVFKASTFAQVTCVGAANVSGTYSTSDYRIKANVTELNETDTVDAVVPIQYNNTLSGNHEFGLLAHELQEIYPDLVNGEKDGDEYQRVQYNGLIGVLVKEVQDLKQRLAVLNNR